MTAMKLLGGLLVLIGVSPVMYLAWSAAGDRSARSIEISENIRYERVVVDDAVVHWVTIELIDNVLGQCLQPVVSRPAADGTIAADVATGFVSATGVDVAVNVAFFYPFVEYPHWSSYPAVGEEVTAIGQVVDDGVVHGLASERDEYLVFWPGGGSVGSLPADLTPGMWAKPGKRRMVADGKVVIDDVEKYPRTVAGIDHDRALLHLVVVDGKQPGYSFGLSLAGLGAEMVERGVDDALEFDGGGSATMAATIEGEVTLLSRPSHTRLPGRQRPVATFLGFSDDC